MTWIWRITVTLTLMLALAAGTGVGYLYFGSSTIRQMVHDWRLGLWRTEKAFPGRSAVTVMVLGRDVDRDNRDRILNTKGRTDTILLVRLNFAEQTANILSIPRDTLVRIPGYRGKHKINAAHAYGGPELTAQTIEEFLNVRPDECVVLDCKSFEKAVDMLGGLQVTVAKQMDYDDDWGDLHIHVSPGTQVLNGKQALGFARFRRSNDGRGDTDTERIQRQQQILMAAKEKVMSRSVFFRLPRVIDTIRAGIKSTMTDAQMMALASFAKRLPPSSIHMAILPGVEGRVYVTADDSAARELVYHMFY